MYSYQRNPKDWAIRKSFMQVSFLLSLYSYVRFHFVVVAFVQEEERMLKVSPVDLSNWFLLTFSSIIVMDKYGKLQSEISESSLELVVIMKSVWRKTNHCQREKALSLSVYI